MTYNHITYEENTSGEENMSGAGCVIFPLTLKFGWSPHTPHFASLMEGHCEKAQES